MTKEYIDKIELADAYELVKKIDDKSVDLVFIDPPYQIDNTKAGGNSALAKTIQVMNNELEENEICGSIDIKILDDFMRIMKKPNIYIWCNHKQIPMYLSYFVDKQGCSFDIIVVHKNNATPLFCNKYLTDKEYCLYFRKGAYCQPQSYEKARTVYSKNINIKDKNLFMHPTSKWVDVCQNLIENSTRPNEIVLDCFMGGGTTAIACKELGRHFIGCEINPKWHKIANDRVNKIDANGQTSFILR